MRQRLHETVCFMLLYAINEGPIRRRNKSHSSHVVQVSFEGATSASIIVANSRKLLPSKDNLLDHSNTPVFDVSSRVMSSKVIEVKLLDPGDKVKIKLSAKVEAPWVRRTYTSHKNNYRAK